jgi:hypothetical protein
MIGQSIGKESSHGVVRKGDKGERKSPQYYTSSSTEMIVDITRIYPNGTHRSPSRCSAGIRRDLAPQEALGSVGHTRRN